MMDGDASVRSAASFPALADGEAWLTNASATGVKVVVVRAETDVKASSIAYNAKTTAAAAASRRFHVGHGRPAGTWTITSAFLGGPRGLRCECRPAPSRRRH